MRLKANLLHHTALDHTALDHTTQRSLSCHLSRAMFDELSDHVSYAALKRLFIQASTRSSSSQQLTCEHLTTRTPT